MCTFFLNFKLNSSKIIILSVRNNQTKCSLTSDIFDNYQFICPTFILINVYNFTLYRNTQFDYYRQFDYFRYNALLVPLFEVGSCLFLQKSNCAKCSCAVRKCFKNFLAITGCNT